MVQTLFTSGVFQWTGNHQRQYTDDSVIQYVTVRKTYVTLLSHCSLYNLPLHFQPCFIKPHNCKQSTAKLQTTSCESIHALSVSRVYVRHID